jgi:hypothetical protein
LRARITSRQADIRVFVIVIAAAEAASGLLTITIAHIRRSLNVENMDLLTLMPMLDHLDHSRAAGPARPSTAFSERTGRNRR